MSKKLFGIIALLVSTPSFGLAEQYLKLKSGNKYLGRVSSADPKKFIFCDAKVGAIPDNAQLEDTQEQCGQVWTLNVPKYRLLEISEGAAAEKNASLAKDALNTAVILQNKKVKTDAEIKSDMGKIESKAGEKLQDYLEKGQSILFSPKLARP